MPIRLRNHWHRLCLGFTNNVNINGNMHSTQCVELGQPATNLSNTATGTLFVIVNANEQRYWNKKGSSFKVFADTNQTVWRYWKFLDDNNHIVWVFAIENPENSDQYLYAYKDDNRLKLKPDDDPSNGISATDDRLFFQTTNQTLEHVNSGSYLLLKKGRRLLLEKEPDLACEVLLDILTED